MIGTATVQTKLLTLHDRDAIAVEVDRLLGYGLPISFDGEMTGFDPHTDKLVLLTFKAPSARTLMIDARELYTDDKAANKRVLAKLLRPLFGAGVELWGQNLQFDLYWMLVHLGIENEAYTSDTMLREQLILGSGYEGGEGVSLEAMGERYGVPVSKEERMWFPGLDKRLELRDAAGVVLDTCTVEESAVRRKALKIKHFTEVEGYSAWKEQNPTTDDSDFLHSLLAAGWTMPWFEPIPDAQVAYARQDVVSVIRIHKAQEASIKEQGLGRVADMESRVLPVVVRMKAYGVGVDRDVFGGVLHDVHVKSEEYAVELHEALDAAILDARQTEYERRMKPFQQWLEMRDTYMSEVERNWKAQAEEGYTKKNGTTGTRKRKDYTGPGWGEVKKEALAHFKEDFPEPSHPAPLKYGVNLNSPAQIVTGLRGIGLMVGSADQKALAPFAGDSDVIGRTVQAYLWYSDYKTVEKRWGNGWMDEHLVPEDNIDPHTGEVVRQWRWYVDWYQIGAGTGRFSSGFQQVNKRGPGAGLRKAFVPRRGFKLVVADFSNVELRIAAALSGDQFLLGAFSSGLDLHTYTAEIMFDLTRNPAYMRAKAQGADAAKDWADTTDAVIGGRTLLNVHYRDIAKTINFSVLYGAGVRNLAMQLHVEVRIAQQLKQIHYNAFHVVLDWINVQGQKATGREARATGRVFSVTRSGRRRWFTLPQLDVTTESTAQEVRDAQDTYRAKIADIKRSLANAPVQGISADITKRTMILWHERYESPDMHLIFTLHDELALEVRDDTHMLRTARNGLRECMLEAMAEFIPEVDPGKVEPVVSDWWKH